MTLENPGLNLLDGQADYFLYYANNQAWMSFDKLSGELHSYINWRYQSDVFLAWARHIMKQINVGKT